MPSQVPKVLSVAVEGDLDEIVVSRLIRLTGGVPGHVYGKKGKAFLLQKLTAYNNAARYSPWLVVVDLDQDADCAPPFALKYLPDPSRSMIFRIAVREIESWIMADRESLAEFLGVKSSWIPGEPEKEEHPKRRMVDIARRSRRKAIREDMVPRPGSGRTVGPAYSSRMMEFIMDPKNGWRPEVAAELSESLFRCLVRLKDFLKSDD